MCQEDLRSGRTGGTRLTTPGSEGPSPRALKGLGAELLVHFPRCGSPALAGRFFTTEPPWKPLLAVSLTLGSTREYLGNIKKKNADARVAPKEVLT